MQNIPDAFLLVLLGLSLIGFVLLSGLVEELAL
jgi:hypothetical protein